MTLLEQLKQVAISEIGEDWWHSCNPPRIAFELACKAFIDGWPRQEYRSRVVLQYWRTLNTRGGVRADEPGVPRWERWDRIQL